MELHYRLVNHRDKETQKNLRFGPQNHQEYKYPTINVGTRGYKTILTLMLPLGSQSIIDAILNTSLTLV